MRIRTIAMVMGGAMALAGRAEAQTPPPITRVVVAADKLSSVTDTPLYFEVVHLLLPPGSKADLSHSSSFLYQLSGSTAILLDGTAKTIEAGEALFLPSAERAQLRAGGTAAST